VTAEAHVIGETLGDTKFGSGGQVDFFFAVEQLKAPGVSPIVLPVYFEAQGFGSISSSGSASGAYTGSARLNVGGFPISRFLIGGLHNADDTFNDSVTLDLRPDREYRGIVVADCQAVDTGYTSSSLPGGAADCIVSIDPEIGFDQAAFDALMGANTFRLDEYYQIVFSPNIPAGGPQPPGPSIPEPSTAVLLGAGLFGLAALRRRASQSRRS
ncbi:MAG: PEP-CTERM sorting domain-containing protein, partial [Sulfuricella sp.]